MKFSLTSLGLALLILAQFGWCAANQGETAIHLRDQAEVNHSTVLLSDLLPAQAPIAIRAASERVELCRAPLPGSVRILRAEQILTASKSQSALFSRLVTPPTVTIRSLGWPICESRVRAAISEFLQKQGPAATLPEAARLYLPESLAANEESIQLRVTNMQWDPRQPAIEFRLRCLRQNSCSNFLVRAVLPQSEQWSRRLTPAILSGHSSAAPMPVKPVLGRGKAATLILDTVNMRISLPVICLEPGLLNQRIRVFDRQSRRVYLAQIIGDHLLRASL